MAFVIQSSTEAGEGDLEWQVVCWRRGKGWSKHCFVPGNAFYMGETEVYDASKQKHEKTFLVAESLNG